jgi:hypothetical protein
MITAQPVIADDGEFHVIVNGYRFWPGEKYTILEIGWAVYGCQEGLPSGWMEQYGETRPADGERPELRSHDDCLITSHPVLVALSIRAWWSRNGKTHPQLLSTPNFLEAVVEVAGREILNNFNFEYAGKVPGLDHWNLDGTRKLVQPK